MAIAVDTSPAAKSHDISATTAGYGLSAAFTAIFNTVLAWVKDANPGLNTAMKHMLGHHWTTHGVIDVVLFLVLGYVLSQTAMARHMDGNKLAKIIIGASVLGGGGLAVWFFLV